MQNPTDEQRLTNERTVLKDIENYASGEKEICTDFDRNLLYELPMDIGYDLVCESTCYDILHAKNLPTVPKDMDAYFQIARQLEPEWDALRKKNEPYKLKMLTCRLCHFKTESQIVLAIHRQTLHFDGRKYQCTMCAEYFTNEYMMSQHYLKQHGLIANKNDDPPRNPCPTCDEDFKYKKQRDRHLKRCIMGQSDARLIMDQNQDQDESAANQEPWEDPVVNADISQLYQLAQNKQTEQWKHPSQGIMANAPRQQQTNFVTEKLSHSIAKQQSQISTPTQIRRLEVPHYGQSNHLMFRNVHPPIDSMNSLEVNEHTWVTCGLCSCRMWTHEELEEHLLMEHGLVIPELLAKAERNEDRGRCTFCGKLYEFNILEHVTVQHNIELYTSNLIYYCEVCSFESYKYSVVIQHLSLAHPKNH